MTKRPFSPEVVTFCWLLLAAQNRLLLERIEALTKSSGGVINHIPLLAAHMMAYLSGVIDQQAVERAKNAHKWADAFGPENLPAAHYVLDAFAAVVRAAGFPPSIFADIIALAKLHGVPVEEQSNLVLRSNEAFAALDALGREGITGGKGVDPVMSLIESVEGGNLLMNGTREEFLAACRELLGLVESLAGKAGNADASIAIRIARQDIMR